MEQITKDHFKNINIEKLFNNFSNKKVLIIGDVMIDAYLFGNVERISPEAPVPVVSVKKRNNRLGGAANVALNVKAMGAEAFLCSVTGDDLKGKELIHLMKEEKLNSKGITKDPSRITTTKFRIFGNHTQMLRVDEEIINPLAKNITIDFIETVKSILNEEKIDVIIFQDYDKGLITPYLIKEVCSLAKKNNTPVAVDPKRKNFSNYHNIDLFKPNLKEFKEGLKLDFDHKNNKAFQAAINILHQNQNIANILITLSNDGIYVSENELGKHIPAHIRNIADVSGAGDTVISIAALCLASGLTAIQTAAIGNLAGGIVCEEVGVVPVNKDKLMNEVVRNYCY